MEPIEVVGLPGFREPVSSISHLIAACLFSIAGFFLVRRGRRNWLHKTSLVLLAVTSVFLLTVSGVYHMLGPGPGRHVMRQIDVAGIFLLIAGTVTPVHAILFRGFNRWVPLAIAWVAAISGMTLRIVFWENFPPGLGNGIFLLLGWGGLVSCVLLWRRYGFTFVRPLLLGGVAYTLGVIVLGLKRPVLIPGVISAHELWHLAVILGLALHWKFVFQFASGRAEPLAGR